MLRFSYHLHGLNISSSIMLPELDPVQETDPNAPCITICEGLVPESLIGACTSTEGYQVTDAEILIIEPYAGRMLVRQGNQIIVQMAADTDEAVMRFTLLGAGLSALLIQIGHFPLHCGAVALGGRVVAFAGVSQTGKSTLTAQFAGRGFSVVTDDRLIMHEGAGGFVTSAGVPLFYIAPDAARATGFVLRKSLQLQQLIDINPYRAVNKFSSRPAKLSTLIFLNWNEKDETIHLTPLDSFAALQALREQVIYESYLRILGCEEKFLIWAVRMLKGVKAYQLTRPKSFGRADEVLDIITRTVGGQEMSLERV